MKYRQMKWVTSTSEGQPLSGKAMLHIIYPDSIIRSYLNIHAWRTGDTGSSTFRGPIAAGASRPLAKNLAKACGGWWGGWGLGCCSL